MLQKIDKIKNYDIIKIEIRSHMKWSPVIVNLNTHSNRQAECVFVYFSLPNICTSTIIKAMFMIVTDTKPANNNLIVNIKYCSTIDTTSLCWWRHTPAFPYFFKYYRISLLNSQYNTNK